MGRSIQVSPIRTEEDYESALDRMRIIIESSPLAGSPEADELDILNTLVASFEDAQVSFPLNPVDPIDMIRDVMEKRGLKTRDMASYFGSAHRASEVLNRKRGLSLAMIRRLHDGLQIPLETLIREPKKQYRDKTGNRGEHQAA